MCYSMRRLQLQRNATLTKEQWILTTLSQNQLKNLKALKNQAKKVSRSSTKYFDVKSSETLTPIEKKLKVSALFSNVN